jgi:hypothetical protein
MPDAAVSRSDRARTGPAQRRQPEQYPCTAGQQLASQLHLPGGNPTPSDQRRLQPKPLLHHVRYGDAAAGDTVGHLGLRYQAVHQEGQELRRGLLPGYEQEEQCGDHFVFGESLRVGLIAEWELAGRCGPDEPAQPGMVGAYLLGQPLLPGSVQRRPKQFKGGRGEILHGVYRVGRQRHQPSKSCQRQVAGDRRV